MLSHERPGRRAMKRLLALLSLALMAVVLLEGRPLAIAGIHAYRRALSPLVERAGVQCRFSPTCSRYAEAVIARDGLARGGLKALKRIARCGPWTPPGTVDNP